MSVPKWEYLWRQTYWVESARQGDYIQWISYTPVWKPDVDGEPEPFPDDSGLDRLGSAGWELVAMTPSPLSLVTRVSPQQGDAYSEFMAYLLIFKRPLLA